MDKTFKKLLEEAKRIAIKRRLSEYATCGHVGCALITKGSNIYSGISSDTNCALGNCAEFSAISEMLKNGESEIVKLVSYSSKGQIYSPCGRCRELIRMVDNNNVNTKVLINETTVMTIKELLPEMYITKVVESK